MIVEKREIIAWLVDTGDEKNAWEADAALPEKLDTEQDRELMEKHGVNIESLLNRIHR